MAVVSLAVVVQEGAIVAAPHHWRAAKARGRAVPQGRRAITGQWPPGVKTHSGTSLTSVEEICITLATCAHRGGREEGAPQAGVQDRDSTNVMLRGTACLVASEKTPMPSQHGDSLPYVR